MENLTSQQQAFLDRVETVANTYRTALLDIQTETERALASLNAGYSTSPADGNRFAKAAAAQAELTALCQSARWVLVGVSPYDREELLAQRTTAGGQ